MSNLSHRLRIVISVSALAMMVSDPVYAKPPSRPKPVIISQLTNKAAVKASVSRQPTDAILANARLKVTTPAKPVKLAPRSVGMVKPVARTTKKVDRLKPNRSDQGTETFTKVDRSNPRSNKSSGIDRWVD